MYLPCGCSALAHAARYIILLALRTAPQRCSARAGGPPSASDIFMPMGQRWRGVRGVAWHCSAALIWSPNLDWRARF